jgi:branched-chain amino acid transport system substrate-binding protein
MNRGRAGALACALAIAALAAGGCASSSSSPAPGAPLTIGYLASLSGYYCAPDGRQYLEGAQLAVKRINARGGVLGRRLTLAVRDDRNNQTTAVARARQLVEGGRVKYLAGACSSAVALKVAQLVANPGHVLYVAGAADPSVFAGAPESYVFGTIPTATIEGRNAAAYIRAHPRWQRIAVIGDDAAYGFEVTSAFRRALRGSGQTVVSQQFVPSGGKDFTSYIRALLAARPDAVYSTVISDDALTLVEQGRALGLFDRTRFFGVMDYGTLAAMPRPPVGARGYTVYPSAAIYRTPFAADLTALGATVANGGAAGDAFNQIEVIAQGIDKAGSTDPAKVRDALEQAQLQTVQGEVKIHRCNHLLAVPIAMGTVAPANSAQPFAHLQPLALVATNSYREC